MKRKNKIESAHAAIKRTTDAALALSVKMSQLEDELAEQKAITAAAERTVADLRRLIRAHIAAISNGNSAATLDVLRRAAE